MRIAALALMLLLVSASAPDERTYMVTGFDRVRVEGPFTVEIVTGAPRATAAGAPLALDRLGIRVEGSTLVINAGTIGWETGNRARIEAPRITISVPALRGVAINGGARVRIAEMKGARVDLSLNGGGEILVGNIRADALGALLTGGGGLSLSGTAGQVRVRSYGAGSVDAGGLTANDAVLISESSGEMRMAVRYTARVMALGSGRVSVSGQPECKVSGTGPVECGTAR